MGGTVSWNGVFPAVTTQFRSDFSLDVEATTAVMARLIADGVSGLIVCGTVGENCSLSRAEKIAVMESAVDVAGGQVPVVAGVAEFTTSFACEIAQEAERVGVGGLMVLPAMGCTAKAHETLFRLARDGRLAEAMPLYDWFMPLLHLDARSDLVQCIKLCEHLAGRGSPLTRPPRLPLEGAERPWSKRL